MAFRSYFRSTYRWSMLWIVMAIMGLLLFGCSNSSNNDGDGDGNTGGGVVTSSDIVVLAWNDLGMHCLNPTYDQLIILPPYNTLWAQVIERGNPPRVVTSGYQVTYSILDNTTSLNKLSYDQFWDPAVLALFGAQGLLPDTGLNLHDPTIHNGLVREHATGRRPLPGRRHSPDAGQRRHDQKPLPGRRHYGQGRRRRHVGADPRHGAHIGRDQLRQVPCAGRNPLPGFCRHSAKA